MQSLTSLAVWVSLPMLPPASSEEKEVADQPQDPWAAWTMLRALCEHHTQLGLILTVPASLSEAQVRLAPLAEVTLLCSLDWCSTLRFLGGCALGHPCSQHAMKSSQLLSPTGFENPQRVSDLFVLSGSPGVGWGASQSSDGPHLAVPDQQAWIPDTVARSPGLAGLLFPAGCAGEPSAAGS